MKRVILKHKSGDEIEAREYDTMIFVDKEQQFDSDQLKALGYKVIEPREPLKWSGEVYIGGISHDAKSDMSYWNVKSGTGPFNPTSGKRFRCELVEIVGE